MTASAFESGTAQTFTASSAHNEPSSTGWDPAPHATTDDHLLPPPNPAQRLHTAIGPRDRRRLDLNAALTTAGVPPRLEDREAIDQLSALPDSINATIQRWIRHTTRA
ncbi:hypothetical protein GCM10011579_035350 [Streptomyces albiflavescens]|uniref:Uncharacterized protein n=1 Tax=Streptomyces albiflavescens TaxID=1623582 RepID=A0A917Y360_9ACTN|nr:hypothetical protein [Streptomyces albiflavescens]GGN65169.1 hypothetical protein GCM10011579_035350 [Streptomyces albiflavescens]